MFWSQPRQKEIDQIAHGINITRHFEKYLERPAIKLTQFRVFERISLTADTALMIGDSKSDFIADSTESVSCSEGRHLI